MSSTVVEESIVSALCFITAHWTCCFLLGGGEHVAWIECSSYQQPVKSDEDAHVTHPIANHGKPQKGQC